MPRPIYEYDISQDVQEFASFVELLIKEEVNSYLEIGSFCGGTLWWVATEVLPARSPDTKIVSIDKPVDLRASMSLKRCSRRLKEMGYLPQLVIGDSQSQEIVDQVRKLGPFDAVFIDGDHTRAGVEADWMHYGDLGRIVAFHGIGWVDYKQMAVRPFWDQLKQKYRHQEIIRRPERYGIGVLWRK